MKVGILGLGYVGLTSAGCMLEQGHSVVGVEPHAEKLADLSHGVCPISEPGLDDFLKRGTAAKRWTFYPDTVAADVGRCDIILVCVGTPAREDGSLNMEQIELATDELASALAASGRAGKHTIVYRTTMPPGSMEFLVRPRFEKILGSDCERVVELVYNPEFMRETSAIEDYFHPSRIVVGTADRMPCPRLSELNRDVAAPWFHTSFAEAEFVKLVDNAWHALKVAFANEIGRFASEICVSADKTHEIFISDSKLNISPSYLVPGGPFGGSCLPKDLRALAKLGKDAGVEAPLIASVLEFERGSQRLPRWSLPTSIGTWREGSLDRPVIQTRD